MSTSKHAYQGLYPIGRQLVLTVLMLIQQLTSQASFQMSYLEQWLTDPAWG